MRRFRSKIGNRYLHVTLFNTPDPKPIFERGSFAGASAKARAKGGQLQYFPTIDFQRNDFVIAHRQKSRPRI